MSDLIIMAAVNGARRTKMDHPNLPVTPDEIAAEAKRCAAAGAAVVHVHARDTAGAHTVDAVRYREVLDAIAGEVGDRVIVQVTTEADGRYAPADLMAAIRALKPEAVSLALRDICPDPSDEAEAATFLGWLKDEGIWPQFVVFDTAEARRLLTLRAAGAIPFRLPYLLFVLGRYTPGQMSAPADLDPFLFEIAGEVDLRWSMCAFGSGEAACARHALALGGDVRVGFENNLRMPDGRQAAYSADLVSVTREAGLALGRRRLDAAAVRERLAEWIG